MTRRLLLATAAVLLPLAAMAQTRSAARKPAAAAAPKPPVAPKQPKRIEQLGRVRTDDYAWMKDDDWQKVMRDPKVLRADIRRHLEAENAYTTAMLKSTEPLQAKLFEEMKGRIKEVDSSVPAPDGPWAYFIDYQQGAQHPRYLRRTTRDADAAPEVLIDADALAKGHAFYDIGQAEHSPDHTLFAYAEDDQGSEVYTLRIKDLASGQLLPDPVDSSTGNFTFSPDSRWLFWTFRDENGRPTRIYRRPARGTKKDDVLVYEEKDPGMFIGVSRTADDRFILISIGDQETSEARYLPATDMTGQFRVMEPRRKGVKYDADRWSNHWVIRTNADDAVDFKLVFADDADPSKRTWQEWIQHRPGTFLVGFQPYAHHLVRLERVNALNRLVVTEGASMTEHEVGFPEEAYALGLEGGYEFETPLTRFVYQSPTTPKQWFDYDMNTRERTLRKTQEIPSGHDPKKYEARRLQARASDGELVPVTVLMKRGTKLDGSSPLLLYGYGSYGIPMDAGFNTNRLSLVDRGWIFAVAHIRGGSEKGWNWFLQGRKEKKPNTFTDFIAAAEHLIAEGYGSKGRIVAQGGSAGGLLMGAVANLRPDLWSGVIAQVPFVDVLNTMSDTSLPLTPPEWPEWGNPIEDAAAYDLILSYSPYDQVSRKAYPAILAEGGLSDPRVTYWEPAKWAAKLREHTTSANPVLLKINMEAGHGGASGRFDYLKEVARAYAFAIWADARGWERPFRAT